MCTHKTTSFIYEAQLFPAVQIYTESSLMSQVTWLPLDLLVISMVHGYSYVAIQQSHC